VGEMGRGGIREMGKEERNGCEGGGDDGGLSMREIKNRKEG